MEKQAKIVKLITVLTVCIMCICLIILTFQLIKIANLKEKNKDLETYKQQLVEDIYNYNTSNSYYDNNRSEFLEDYAREVLGWGTQDEIIYKKN